MKPVFFDICDRILVKSLIGALLLFSCTTSKDFQVFSRGHLYWN